MPAASGPCERARAAPQTLMAHIARKRFGQHFLSDRFAIEAIVDAIAPLPTDALVEIGPGLGAMTFPLLDRCQQLTVIELDRDLAARLRRRAELTVIEADVLNVDFDALATAARQPLRVVGNLPYNISTPILFHLLPSAAQVVDQTLTDFVVKTISTHL